MDNKSAYAVRESLSPDQKQLLFDHKYEGAGRARAVFEKTIIGEDIGDRLKAFDGKLTDSLIVDGTAAKYYETQCYVKMDNAVYDAAKRDAVDGVKSFSYSLSGDSHILVEYVDWADGSTKTFKMPIEDLFGEYDKAIKNIDDDTLNLLIHGKDFSKMTGVPEDVIADALISGKSTQDMIDLLPDDYKQQWLKSMNTAVKVSDSGETANLICFIQESNLNKYSKGWQADPKTLVGYGNGSGQWCLSVDGLQQKIKDPNFVASLQRDLGLDLSKIDDWSEKDIQHLVEYIIAVPEGSMDGVRAITANMNITIDNITCNIAEGANSQYCFGGVTLGGIYECTTIDKIPCGVPKGGSDLISLIKSIGGY